DHRHLHSFPTRRSSDLSELGASEVLRFSEGNLFVRVGENVRGRDVFVVQGTAFPANDNFMELLFWIDALKRASASSVTAADVFRSEEHTSELQSRRDLV